MAFEVNVKVLEILPEQRGTSSRGEWVKNSFIGETLGEYPKKMFFEVLGQERWDKIRQYVQVGREVKVSFDVDSHEWKSRWFTSLICFSVYGGGGQHEQVSVPNAQSAPQTPVAPTPVQQTNDDVPF